MFGGVYGWILESKLIDMKKVKILFASDFSDNSTNALRYAIILADQLRASIHLLHVTYPESDMLGYTGMVSSVLNSDAVRTCERQLKKQGLKALSQVQETYVLDSKLMITEEVELGLPIKTISAKAEQEGFDLIIMGTRAEHSRWENWMGTVSSGVVEISQTPVLVVPENAKFYPIRKVGYASEFKKSDPYFIWESGELLDSLNFDLYCIHVDTPKGNDGVFDEEKMKRYFRNFRSEQEIHFVNKEGAVVGEELEKTIEHLDLDMMIIQSEPKGLFQQIFGSSTAKKMIFRSPVPVLILR